MSRSESPIEAVINALPGPIVLVEANGRILNTNRAGRALLSLKRSDATGRSIRDCLADSREHVDRFLKKCGTSLSPVVGRATVKSPLGADAEFVVTGARVRPGDSNEPATICLQFADEDMSHSIRRFRTLNDTIEKLKQEIVYRKRIETMLEAEKSALASVVHGKSLTTALDILARAIENENKGMWVSMLLLDDQERLRHASAPNLPASYTQAIDGIAIGPEVGSCGTAAFTRSTVITRDIKTDPKWKDYVDIAEAADLRSCWSTPIMSSRGDCLGTLALYYQSPREPTDEEIQLINDSAYVASLAIERYQVMSDLEDALAREKEFRERAELENQRKDEFLATLSHELRNPLGAISNATNALKFLPDDPKREKSLRSIIESETMYLKRILDDLLDLSRLSTGKLRLEVETFDLGELIHETLESMSAAYPDRVVKLQSTSESCNILADRPRMRQALQNLIDNAIKFSGPNDEVILAVKVEEENIRIVVEDSGEGIEPVLMPTIFDAFVQAPSTSEDPNAGLGLGLALVKNFTEMHGGKLEAKSKGAGEGSQFIITLPRSETESADDTNEESTAIQDHSRKRVVVVEDNEAAREGLCHLLSLWGHDVVSAGDGEKAIEVIRESKPQIAFVDIGIPLIDGYGVARTIRKDLPEMRITMVALTGFGQESDRQRAVEAGFDSHIVKPAEIRDLVAVLGSPP